jgi:hypothetical protein
MTKQKRTVKRRLLMTGRSLWLLALLLPILTACAVAPVATIPFIPLERTATSPADAAASLPADAGKQTATARPAPSDTPEPQRTPTPYMGIDFSQVQLYQGGFLSDFRYFVSFKFPEDVRGEYHVLVNDNKDYACVVLPDYPSRLYCSGPLVAVNNRVEIELYAGEVEQPVWSGEFFVPEM